MDRNRFPSGRFRALLFTLILIVYSMCVLFWEFSRNQNSHRTSDKRLNHWGFDGEGGNIYFRRKLRCKELYIQHREETAYCTHNTQQLWPSCGGMKYNEWHCFCVCCTRESRQAAFCLHLRDFVSRSLMTFRGVLYLISNQGH